MFYCAASHTVWGWKSSWKIQATTCSDWFTRTDFATWMERWAISMARVILFDLRFSVLRGGEDFYACCRKRGVANNGEQEEVQVKQEGVVEVERVALLYTKAFGHYEQSSRTKRHNHTSVIKRPIQPWQKGSSLMRLRKMHDCLCS